MPLQVYGGFMTDFLAGCASLFSATFHAAGGVDFFLLLYGYIMIQLAFVIFCAMSKGLRKL